MIFITFFLFTILFIIFSKNDEYYAYTFILMIIILYIYINDV